MSFALSLAVGKGRLGSSIIGACVSQDPPWVLCLRLDNGVLTHMDLWVALHLSADRERGLNRRTDTHKAIL